MGKAEETFHATVEALVMGQPVVNPAAIRFTRQQAIEEAITTFNPDYTEAYEFVHAIWAALETKHGDLPSGVKDALDDLCLALEGAE